MKLPLRMRHQHQRRRSLRRRFRRGQHHVDDREFALDLLHRWNFMPEGSRRSSRRRDKRHKLRRKKLWRQQLPDPAQSPAPAQLKKTKKLVAAHSLKKATPQNSQKARSGSGFTKVINLRPRPSGVDLRVKVLRNELVKTKGITLISECVVEDETGECQFRAKSKQVQLMKVGCTVVLKNSKVEKLNGQKMWQMRVSMTKKGSIEVVEPPSVALTEQVEQLAL